MKKLLPALAVGLALGILPACGGATGDDAYAPWNPEPPSSAGLRPFMEVAFPGERGELKTMMLETPQGVMEVTYKDVRGHRILEGDILLPGVSRPDRDSNGGLGTQRSGLAGVIPVLRWPGNAIFYEIDPALPDPQRVLDAIHHWEANTPIRFLRHTTEPNYVVFVPGTGCWAHIGRIGGRQLINLGPDCDKGNVIHEIGHAVGSFTRSCTTTAVSSPCTLSAHRTMPPGARCSRRTEPASQGTGPR